MKRTKRYRKGAVGGTGGEILERRQLSRASEMRSYSRRFAQAKDRGLDQTLSDTFPCSDALSSIPDPPVENVESQIATKPETVL